MSDQDNLSDEQLDGLISSHYRRLEGASVPSRLRSRVVRSARSRSETRILGRTTRRSIRFAAGALVVLAIVAIATAAVPILRGGPALPAQPTPSITASPSGSGVATAAPSPSTTPSTTASFLPGEDPSLFTSDPRLKACGGLAGGIEAVVPLDHAWAYRLVMPGLGFIAQLDVSAEPALLVVYSGPVPAALDWRNYPMPQPTTIPSPTPMPTLAPGLRNVCLDVTGADGPQIVEKARIASFHPESASLAVRPATPVGQARVVTRNKQDAYSLAWDSTARVLWYTVQFPGIDSGLYRLDPATGATKRWALPDTDYNGFLDMVVVDATGAVWFDMSGVHLYRLDPATGKVTRHDIDLKAKPAPGSGGMGVYITAIAADGDGVVIARESLAYLTRVDSSLQEVGHIAIPSQCIGTDELGVAGDRLIVGCKPDSFVLLSRSGELIRTLPLQRWLAVQGPSRILPVDSGRVALADNNELDLVDASGDVTSRVPLALDLPIGSFGDTGQFESNARPQTIATDWQGTFWYALGTYIVEVRTE
jgi:hypothetical protein